MKQYDGTLENPYSTLGQKNVQTMFFSDDCKQQQVKRSICFDNESGKACRPQVLYLVPRSHNRFSVDNHYLPSRYCLSTALHTAINMSYVTNHGHEL